MSTSYIFNFWGSAEQPQPHPHPHPQQQNQEIKNKPNILDELKNFQKNGKLKTTVRTEIVVFSNPIWGELKNFQKNGKLKKTVRTQVAVVPNPVWEEVLEKRNLIINKSKAEKIEIVEAVIVDVADVREAPKEQISIEEVYKMLKEVNTKLDYLLSLNRI